MQAGLDWIKRALDLAIDCLFASAFFLIPLLFSEHGTHTIVIKEIAFQAITAQLGVLLSLGWLIQSKVAHRLGRLPKGLWIAGGLFLLWLVISVGWIAPHPRAEQAFTRWLGYGLWMFFCAYLALSPRRFRLAIVASLCSALLVSGYAMLQAFGLDNALREQGAVWFIEWGGFTWDNSDVRRVLGSMGNPDYLAGYLVALIPLTALSLAASGLWGRLALSALLALEMAALVFTYSRGGWVALIVLAPLLLLAALFAWRQSGTSLIPAWAWGVGVGLTALLIGALVGVLYWLQPEALLAWWQRIETLGEDMATVSRWYFYEGTLAMWASQPLLGHGLGMFDVQFPVYRPLALGELLPFKEFRVEHAHNELLQIGAELGLIGLALYLGLIGAAMRFAWQQMRSLPVSVMLLMLGVAGVLGGTLIHNLFTVTLRYTPSAFLLWSSIGLLVGAASQAVAHTPRVKAPARLGLAFFALLASGYVGATGLSYYCGNWMIQQGIEQLAEITDDNPRSENRAILEQSLLKLWRGNELEPANVEAYFYLGLAYNKSAFDYVQAEDVYRQLERLYPNFTFARMNISTNALDQAALLGSHEMLSVMLTGRLLPRPPIEPFTEIAMRPIEDVVTTAQQAMEDDPTEPIYPYLLGRARYAQLRFDEAIEQLNIAIEKAQARSPHMYRWLIDTCRQYIQNIQMVKRGEARLYDVPAPKP